MKALDGAKQLILIYYLLRWLKLLPDGGNKAVFPFMDAITYKRWFTQFDSFTKADRVDVIKALEVCSYLPKIGIVPISRKSLQKHHLRTLERGLKNQVYSNWALLYQSGESADASAARGSLSAQLFLDAAQEADFVLPLPIDGVLSPHALALFVLALSVRPEAEIIYADEDRLFHGMRCEPYFKTDWDPFLIFGCNYTGLPILFKSELLQRAKLKDLSSYKIDNLLHAIVVRASRVSSVQNILHIPSILFHRESPSDWSAMEASAMASCDEKLGEHVTILFDPNMKFGCRVDFAVPEKTPSVSILIPTRDHAEVLARCIDGLLNDTNYPSFEIIIIDNGSTESAALEMFSAWQDNPKIRIIRDDRPFNYSQLNNAAAKIARGDILVLLNNDIEIIDPDWLKELVSLASLQNVGVAGAKLLYPDHRVQHAGITFGPNDAVLHEMQLAERSDPGPHGELGLLRSVSAVTGACLAIRRELYWQVGGLDEEFKVAFNDVDLCRRVAALGYSIVWTPFAELIHHECLSRGPLSNPQTLDRELSEQMKFWSRHSAFYESQDPFHNPQIEFRGTVVDFARPPRHHPLRGLFRDKTFKAFVY